MAAPGQPEKEAGGSGHIEQSETAEEWNREGQSRIVTTDEKHEQAHVKEQGLKQEQRHELNQDQKQDQNQDREAEAEQKPAAIMRLELKRLGLVIEILRRPQIADVDRSGIITASEAVLLGCALSLDSFGAGLGAAMVGFSPFITALIIGVSSGLFLLGGMKLGFRFSTWRAMQNLSILPGIMLIVMGILKLF